MNEYTIFFNMPDGSEAEGIIQHRDNDSTHWIRVSIGDIQVFGDGGDYFDSLAKARDRLIGKGIFPNCYGASKKVWPSAMSRDMGSGLKAYKIQIGDPATEIVSIFDSGKDVEISTPKEQKEYANQWFDSLAQ